MLAPSPYISPPQSCTRLHDLLDVLLEQAERVGVGDHDAGDGVVAGRAHRFEIDVAARIGGQLDRGEPGHGGGGRVGAVRGVGNEDARPLGVAARVVIGAHHQQAGEFAVRAGRGLQRHAGKTADLGEPLLQLEHQRQVALHRVRVLQRMRLGEAGQPRDLLVDLRVVLHGAGAERIESGIDAEIALRQRKVVPHHVELRQFRQAGIGAPFVRRQRGLRHVAGRQIGAVPAGHAQLVDGGNGVCVSHRTASASPRTSRSMLVRALTSVTAISM